MKDTYTSFSGRTKAEVLALVNRFGNANNFSDSQNLGPTLQKFLDLEAEYPRILYNGYIIKKPRLDYRVTIEGCDVRSLTTDELKALQKMFRAADESKVTEFKDPKKKGAKRYDLYVWYD